MDQASSSDVGAGETTNNEKKSKKADDNSPADVAFLYKTMLQRDPSKRRVKPVEQHLMQIHFGMSDDDDTDSDYEFKPGADSDDDVGSDDSTAAFVTMDEEKNTDNAPKASSADSGSDEDSEEGISSGEEESVEKVTPTVTAPKLRVEMKVCCVCLSSSCAEDEIVECDGCGILVHEGCYGTIEEDVLSVHSDMSTESTEPWFCDPCKAGVVPTCELCPNQFGIFKQTDTGRWVHLICALYVPAVAFGNTEKLTNVTLLEMPYTKWGAKECSLCEDENYSYTGVCIGCDAGMCRNFFHVTCAQKQGLLSEAALDEEIADPFYAHCRMHGDKLVSKHKKRNFLALSSHVKHFRATKCNRPVSQRTKRRLEHFKKKFREAEARRPPAWVPPNKLSRSISSSASAVSSLLRKAELLGVVPGTKTQQQKEISTKKSYVAPALSVDFASYYEQRTSKIDSLKKLNSDSEKQTKSLKSQEKKLGEQVEKLRMSIKELQTCHEESRQAGYDIYSALHFLSDSKINIPEKYKPTTKLMSPTAMVTKKGGHSTNPCGICSSTKEQHLLAKCDQCYNYYHLYCLDPPLTRMPKKSKLCGWVCSICDHKNHEVPAETVEDVDTDAPRRLRQIVREPDKFFQPELKLFVEKFRRNPANRARKRARTGPKVSTGVAKIAGPKKRIRGPKKVATKKKTAHTFVGVAAVAAVAETSVQDSKANDEKVLQEKENIADVLDTSNASTAFTPTEMETDNAVTEHLLSPADTAHMSSSATSFHQTSPIKLGRKSKVLETGSCKPCNKECNGGNAVRCDECLHWYHFACLDPPVKKSPKPRGYQWYCDECDRILEEQNTTHTASEGTSESLTMEIVQATDSNEKTVVSFDGDVTTI